MLTGNSLPKKYWGTEEFKQENNGKKSVTNGDKIMRCYALIERKMTKWKGLEANLQG
jgi:hypothetical protein